MSHSPEKSTEKSTDILSEDTGDRTRATLKDGIPHYGGLAGTHDS